MHTSEGFAPISPEDLVSQFERDLHAFYEAILDLAESEPILEPTPKLLEMLGTSKPCP
jgi:hypothetical protein